MSVRLTRRVFADLAIWMVCFGVGIGVAFPFMVLILGVSKQVALAPGFVIACTCAGAIAGVANFSLAKWVVGTRLEAMATAMTRIRENIEGASGAEEPDCSPDDCQLPVDSEDAFGEVARTFNALVDSLSHVMGTQRRVREFGAILASQLDLRTLASSALERLILHSGATAGVLLTEMGGELTVLASTGVRTPSVLGSSDAVRAAMRTLNRVVLDLPEEIVIEGALIDFKPRQVIIKPIGFEGRALGAIVLASPRVFETVRIDELPMFGNSLGVALMNALAHDDLQRIAALDSLTGLYNRRFGETRLREEFNRSGRTAEPLGVAMIDIDHFKAVNDTYGHLAGDRVIKAVARAIKAQIRDGDIAVRFGGEEFLVVLPAASKQDVHRIVERVRRAVADTVIVDGEQRIKVTLSAGVTSSPEQSADDEIALIRRADEALYKAKVGGRNQVLTSQDSECLSPQDR